MFKIGYSISYPSSRVQPNDSEGSRNDHSLLLVIWRRDTLEAFEAHEGGIAAGGLVRHHAPDGPPQDSAGCTEVEWPSPWVHVASLLQERQIFHCENELRESNV